MRMSNSMQSRKSTAYGFTLIELMIAITLGLIVIGALVTFVVSSVTSYSDTARLTRLTQDLRTSLGIVVREVRRSGYDSLSVTRALTSEDPSGYVLVKADEANNCVSYTYDRGVAATESRGFKLDTAKGVLQMKVASTTVDCASTSGWEDVSDPNIVEVTKFIPRLTEEKFCSELGDYTDSAGVPRRVIANGSVRTLAVCVKGRLRADQTVSRHVVDVVRLRADAVDFNTLASQTTKCPALVAVAPPDVVAWNTECQK